MILIYDALYLIHNKCDLSISERLIKTINYLAFIHLKQSIAIPLSVRSHNKQTEIQASLNFNEKPTFAF